MSPIKSIPTQKYIDAQLLNIKSIRIRYPAVDSKMAKSRSILRLLYECGVRGPLEAVIESFEDQTKGDPTPAMGAKLQQLLEQLPPNTQTQLTPNKSEPDLTSSKQSKRTK